MSPIQGTEDKNQIRTFGKKEMMQFHRLLSWWLAIFTILSILSGYAVTREWVTNLALMEQIHLIIQWTFIIILLFHMIYTLGWVKIKTFKLMKKPRKNWVRILQQITKWFIVILTLLVVFTGLNYYSWMDIDWFNAWFPFNKHVDWDFLLSLSIIIHIMTGAKIFFIRNRASTRYTDLSILFLGSLAVIGICYLEFFASR